MNEATCKKCGNPLAPADAVNATPGQCVVCQPASAPQIKVPQLKGLQNLLKKTAEAAADVPATPQEPQAAPAAQPEPPKKSPYNFEELELIDARAQKGEAFNAAEMARMLDTLEIYTEQVRANGTEANFAKFCLLALAWKSGGVLHVRKNWFDAVKAKAEKGLKPQLKMATSEKGDLELRLHTEPEPIVLASEVPAPPKEG